MALNFQLIDKKTDDVINLVPLDEDICKDVLNVEVHPQRYGGIGENSFNWFDTIGFQLASGKTLEEGDNSVRTYYRNSELWEKELPVIESIITYLQDRYTAKNWVSVGR